MIPVITIDGPTASGKGTVAQAVAAALSWNYLDSGALYRVVALAALRGQVDLDDGQALADLALRLEIGFAAGQTWLDGADVSRAIRAEETGNTASRIAVHAALRQALVARQRAFRQAPGLVADGRDMGSAIFTDAALKVYLVASVEARAERRTKQLMENGIFANMSTLLQDLQERDRRDSQRQSSPLAAAPDALVIDSSTLGVDEVVSRILALAAARGLGKG